MNSLSDIYARCAALLGAKRWWAVCPVGTEPGAVPGLLRAEHGLPAYIAELAELEWLRHEVSLSSTPAPESVRERTLNPTVRALQVSHWGLVDILNGEGAEARPGEQMVLLWRGPLTGRIHVRAATNEDLLVMKMMAEGIGADEVAAAGGIAVGAVEREVFRAADSGLVLLPPSRIRRPAEFPRGEVQDSRFFASGSFTLQWHLTQACDLHCTHCYDRSDRLPLAYEKALSILDEFRNFCATQFVEGHVSFSGGNPLLYPRFLDLYSRAVEYGFGVAVMGNPASREQVQQIIDIEMPSFFQISLEGLEARNDAVRGSGHYRRSVEFLRLLKEMSVPTMVMLTLTADNIGDVIPLGIGLEGLADSYNFNRLAQVGEGAALGLPGPERFKRFLNEYLQASSQYPHMRLKDNLFNVLLHQAGRPPMGGCTGHGCGAAFNFVSVLADGEVHACRKFPSRIGNLHEQGLAKIYDSPRAEAYRGGCSMCASCGIRPVCGGCLAVSHGLGMDGLTEKDRFCFLGRDA